MLKVFKKLWKDQRGLTLIELLAVIVILGIIAAIAIPNIVGLTENTRKDAVVAGYKSMGEAARLIVTQKSFQTVDNSTMDNDGTVTTKDNVIIFSIGNLITEGYMDRGPQKFDAPETDYTGTEMLVRLTKLGNTVTYEALKIGGTATTAAHWVLLEDLIMDNLTP
jgi:type IV pilus assembly protein PilA